jgi:2-polyprenyl-6-methoxyphenol hydroxylase-like FAD-dependent oxidoreductase
MPENAIVVGAGLAGLAAACRLALAASRKAREASPVMILGENRHELDPVGCCLVSSQEWLLNEEAENFPVLTPF